MDTEEEEYDSDSFSNDIEDEDFYSKNLDDLSDEYEDLEKENESSDLLEKEEYNKLESIEKSDSEEDSNIKLKIDDINKYKINFLNTPSKLEILKCIIASSYLLKRGGSLIESNKLYEYPSTTEDGEAIESILLGTAPIYSMKHGYLFDISKYNLSELLLVMKRILRPAYNNRIIITEKLLNTFPMFFKHLDNDYITEKEILEIKRLRDI